MRAVDDPFGRARERRRAAYFRGLDAEASAADLLAGLGFEILSRRYRSPAGEIDLVAAKDGHVAFVEVKMRQTLDAAAWSVTPRQQKRIADAAGYWLQAYPEYSDWDMSFDAVLYARKQMEYVTDAFRI